MAACLAQLAGRKGRVLALEKQAKLVERARANISASIPELCNTVDVRVCNVMAGEGQQSLCVGWANSSRQSTDGHSHARQIDFQMADVLPPAYQPTSAACHLNLHCSAAAMQDFCCPHVLHCQNLLFELQLVYHVKLLPHVLLYTSTARLTHCFAFVQPLPLLPDPPELQGTSCFDAIHVGASLTEVPRSFVQLLRPGGRLVLPLGAMHGAAAQVMLITQYPIPGVPDDKQPKDHVTRQEP